MNGLNGGNMPAMVPGYPTPAGYQAELAYIYNMVEVLSQQLAENKRALEDVVSSVGRVRNRARNQQLGNEELISSAADDLGGEFSLLGIRVKTPNSPSGHQPELTMTTPLDSPRSKHRHHHLPPDRAL